MDDTFIVDELPDALEQQLLSLVFNIKDWQITHGMLLKYGPNVEQVSSVPISLSLLPSKFPRTLFEKALKLQTIYNRLYAAVSTDEDWLFGVLKGYVTQSNALNTAWDDQCYIMVGSFKMGPLQQLYGIFVKRSSAKAMYR